jgi:cell division protein FtsQ
MILQNANLYKQNRLMNMGFVVSQVDVMGEGRLDEAEVRRALNIRPGDYFFGVNLREAQVRTESLPWVDRAVVRRLWPDRIVVQLVENQPFALWQNEGALSLVDVSGTVIAPIGGDITIPEGVFHVVGKGAAKNSAKLDALLGEWPGLKSRVSSAVYVSEKRWDLVIDEAITVKLPVTGVEKAFAQLAALQAETQALDRKLSVIDLRLSDRISLRPVDETQA